MGWVGLIAGMMALAGGCTAKGQANQAALNLRFVVGVRPGLLPKPQNGRLYVVLGAATEKEPRFRIGEPSLNAPPTYAVDVTDFGSGDRRVLHRDVLRFPPDALAKIKPGDYTVQAVFDFNRDLKSPNAPGNLYSVPQKIKLGTNSARDFSLQLTEANPPDTLPAETESVRYVKMQSALLSKFYGRPIFLRAGVILPKGFKSDPTRRYPLRIQIGGYGSRYTHVAGMMHPNAAYYQAWNSEGAPPMILLHLDGAGPFGDPYQVNSANHGPYGDAVTKELIPYIEQKFRAIGKPHARVLDGGSTGGWVSFALQVFYPDFFNGCWSYSPDPVDFRAYETINIYKDTNAYTDTAGKERPAARNRDGTLRMTMRTEVGSENLVGQGNSYTTGGGQWGAWNATYSPKGSDGLPAPLWNPQTGAIRSDVAEEWKKYDLRLYLEQNWKTLAPKLRGKIHIWVGEADEYFLNTAVHLLDDFLSKAKPPYEGTIKFGEGKGHVWVDLSERQIMDAMQKRINQAP